LLIESRIHCIAASMHSWLMSAPTYPWVFLAMSLGSTSSARRMFLVWIRKISSRPWSSGTPRSSSRSKRPKRRREASTEPGTEVQPTTRTGRVDRPRLSTCKSTHDTTRFTASEVLPSRRGHRESISSIKMMAGALSWASSNFRAISSSFLSMPIISGPLHWTR